MITEKNNKYFNINNGYYDKNTVRLSRDINNTQCTKCSPCANHPSSYAMSYVLNQKFENMYKHDEALYRGTLFCDLYMPYQAGGIRK